MTSILGRMATYSGQEVQWDHAINSAVSIMPEKYEWDATPPTVPDKDGRYSVAMPGQIEGDLPWQRINRELKEAAGGGKKPAKTAKADNNKGK